ncbi:hypothetical protein STRTUCAR8_08747 [Streptomyces turgidiscabies Car8]|uniref:Uncharacterized protein n=1 Tax=Streptomyces turgidiscabies (strain Car8) TaxID=698760 RepID=L7F0S5_STRT8|nr:hypothetical protein STRTUCAR8_08747 [Streptomyces turgidiscabies Car8]
MRVNSRQRSGVWGGGVPAPAAVAMPAPAPTNPVATATAPPKTARLVELEVMRMTL